MSDFQRPRNGGAAAVARLERNRARWSDALARDQHSRAASRPGLGSLLLGLNTQPWVSAVSTVWMAWRRRDRPGSIGPAGALPPSTPPEAHRAGITGLIKRHPLLALGVVFAVALALNARRSHPPGPPRPH